MPCPSSTNLLSREPSVPAAVAQGLRSSDPTLYSEVAYHTPSLLQLHEHPAPATLYARPPSRCALEADDERS